MRYALIRRMDISNGEGVGIALFVQGCHFRCKGCFNQDTWDFEKGKPWTTDIESKFLELADKPYISRISILGGEPLCDENVGEVYSLINKINNLYPDKKIWLYTGYNYSDIIKSDKTPFDKIRILCVKNVDVIVDGRFELDKQDLYNEKIVFAGSTNQHIIRVKK